MKLSDKYNLKAAYPELAARWHPTKNGDLTPDKVTPFSSKKVWWMCDKGHEWMAVIFSRSKGSRCPFCYMQRARKEYNLSAVKPAVAKQWHPTKNGDLTPGQVTPFSNRKVWWKCDKGHEWMTNISHRSTGTGCPYCSGRKVSKEYNLSVVKPAAAKQWHPAKNGDLTPDKVIPSSSKKVWWMCDKGHEWMAVINCRSNDTGCPFCYKQRASKEYNLSAVKPAVAKQWHPTKNGDLTPGQIAPFSSKKVWWMCDKGHEWMAIINDRSKGAKCPYCCGRKASKEYNLSVVKPAAAKQWHPTKNGDLTPDKVTPFSRKEVWWKCDKGHEWMAMVSVRSKGKGCYFCAKNK